MIIVTGAAGFIGSCLVKTLNLANRSDIIIVDDLGKEDKWKNYRKLKFDSSISIKSFDDRIKSDSVPYEVEVVFHLGANSATTEKDADHLLENNTEFTKRLILWSLKHKIRIIYASSAATYGAGEKGYIDSDALTPKLIPLNMYGYSKKLVDEWVIDKKIIDKIVGLRFFNVYGPNEYHKGEMQSVVRHSFDQIKKAGKVELFKSYKEGYSDGEQKRDFVYVKDVCDVMVFFWKNPQANGIFNVGTGEARTFKDLSTAVFSALNLSPNILFKEMPEHIRKHYQYFTQADLTKLRKAGYNKQFTSLEAGVKDYVQNYLNTDDPYI